MNTHQEYFLAIFAFALSFIESGESLSCWTCDSTTDSSCSDFFNITSIEYTRKAHFAYTGYGMQTEVRTLPNNAQCEMSPKYNQGLKNVCLKAVYSNPRGNKIVQRKCQVVSSDFKTGTCPETYIKDPSLEFCETCEMDACNSANNFNSIILTSLIPTTILLILLGNK